MKDLMAKILIALIPAIVSSATALYLSRKQSKKEPPQKRESCEGKNVVGSFFWFFYVHSNNFLHLFVYLITTLTLYKIAHMAGKETGLSVIPDMPTLALWWVGIAFYCVTVFSLIGRLFIAQKESRHDNKK